MSLRGYGYRKIKYTPNIVQDLDGNDPGRLSNTAADRVRHPRREACRDWDSYYGPETAVPAQWVPWLCDTVVRTAYEVRYRRTYPFPSASCRNRSIGPSRHIPRPRLTE